MKRFLFTNDRKRNPRMATNLIVFVAICILFVAIRGLPAEAAELKLNAADEELNVGQMWQLSLLLNSQGEAINALEGRIIFDQDKLTLRSVSDGNSIVNLWITRPQAENNAIVFSGVMPGGYQDSGGLILTVNFEVKSAGDTVVVLTDGRVLLNDGQGTSAALTITPLNLTISAEAPTSIDLPQPDNDPPEKFQPQIASAPEVFDGRYFLSFATQDKGSGMAYYALYESRHKKDSWLITEGQWQKVVSPWLLADQSLESYIYLKAVDLAGNERLVVLPPRQAAVSWWLSPFFIFAIIITLIIIGGIALMFWFKTKTKFKNYHGQAGDKNKK